MLTRFAVVVPAHDEQDLLPACLTALTAAAAAVGPLPVEIVVVADRCADATADVARAAGAHVLVVDFRNVGRARAAGLAYAMRAGTAGLWLATTDADSRVPPDWLDGHRRHAAAGVDLVVGTVAVDDWAPWPESVRGTYDARYRAGISATGHRHVHGANLGCDARAYAGVGGFAALPHDEDRDLVTRMLAAGAKVGYDVHRPVLTSARPAGRAPAGFAAFLDALQPDG